MDKTQAIKKAAMAAAFFFWGREYKRSLIRVGSHSR